MSEAALERSAAAEQPQVFSGWLVAEMRDNRVIYIFLGVFLTSSILVSALRGDEFLPMIVVYLERTLRAFAVLCSAVIAFVGIRVLLRRADRPTYEIGRTLLAIASNGRLTRLMFSFVVLALFMGSFLYNKTLIPVIRPFGWDATFLAWDTVLFGGYQPWEWLHPVLGYPAVTIVLDYLYSAWVPLVFIVWAWIAVSPNVSPDLRRQYWLAVFLAWTGIGIGMALLFSSAGPCFLPALFPDLAAPYSGLNAYLAGVTESFPLSSTMSKAFLWSSYTDVIAEPGGISAMPSMHNAQAVLFALAGFRISRRLGLALSLYAVLIFLGSIHLAWHYAVDGIVGAIAAVAVWHIAGLASRGRAEKALR
ncbi:phosphatase PAP2 family protein [Mesorhizobium australicum]|uniref:PAP2 superfamily protein n=1 Tax=Mesorhizobium australicum TaxID=536018 RepID=A0A1X7MWX8_9HYPH|nr:phosphatase PAP2 family protein [Mesorhizobium australicum]SMH28561.1 PAP2 superfamily protein [Mesorhizobium australicum]